MQKIQEVRKAKGVKQREIAKALGLPQPRISEMETGKRKITLVEAAKVARFLNVKVDDLVEK